MTKANKLKVYRTPIGFHDAYVAAPSQKAALEAWGSAHNLFARGVAEIVTDDALTKEPLASPGTVIKRSRGTTAEQIAARPAARARPAKTGSKDRALDRTARAGQKSRTPKPKPKPPRDALDAAGNELVRIEDHYAQARRALAAEQAALDQRRADLDKARTAEISGAKTAIARENEKYAAAIRKWRG